MTVPMAAEADPAGCTRRDRLLGWLCFRCAVTLLRAPFRHATAMVAWLGRHTSRPATPAEAASMVTAVRAAAHRYPGRAACLEHSLAAALLAGLRRRRVHWCVGARLMPYAGHAWIELGGQPVGEPAAPDRPYLVLLRV